MTITVGINGFGRIGRAVFAHYLESGRDDIKVVKINATGKLETNMHLLRYDSVHGRLSRKISLSGDQIDTGNGLVKTFSTYDPDTLDWSGVDVVMECSGQFNSRTGSAVHLKNGAGRVLISAPAKDPDRTVVLGVNDDQLEAADRIVSCGSCTTNCLAPLAKVLHEAFGIESGIMTTIHSFTGDQRTVDRGHKDLYRARAASLSMIPTSTGAAKALGEVLPVLAGRLDGSAMRVPTPNVSAVDLTFYAGKDVTCDAINDTVAAAANGPMKGILAYDPEPKVSVDFNHTEQSSIFAPDQTCVVGNRLARVLSWYDNEWAFSCRMCDLAARMGNLG